MALRSLPTKINQFPPTRSTRLSQLAPAPTCLPTDAAPAAVAVAVAVAVASAPAAPVPAPAAPAPAAAVAVATTPPPHNSNVVSVPATAAHQQQQQDQHQRIMQDVAAANVGFAHKRFTKKKRVDQKPLTDTAMVATQERILVYFQGPNCATL